MRPGGPPGTAADPPRCRRLFRVCAKMVGMPSLNPDQFGETVLFHGTHRKLAVGEPLRPAVLTGAERRDADFYSPHHVYATSEAFGAENYAFGAAARHGGEPHVYRVRLAGRMPDPEQVESGYKNITSFAGTYGEVLGEEPLSGRLEINEGRVMRVKKN